MQSSNKHYLVNKRDISQNFSFREDVTARECLIFGSKRERSAPSTDYQVVQACWVALPYGPFLLSSPNEITDEREVVSDKVVNNPLEASGTLITVHRHQPVDLGMICRHPNELLNKRRQRVSSGALRRGSDVGA
jgi:hypothetical protein